MHKLNQWFTPAGAALMLALVYSPALGDTASDINHLIELNTRILSAYIIENDTGPLDAYALPAFFVVTPGGVETRGDVIATVGNVKATGFTITDHAVTFYGDTALHTATITLDGTIVGRRQPPLTTLTVFVKVDGEWRLAARSLTPRLARPSTE